MTKDELSILQKLLEYSVGDIEKLEAGPSYTSYYLQGRIDTLKQIIELFGGAK